MHKFSIKIPKDTDIRATLINISDDCDWFKGDENSGKLSKSGVTLSYIVKDGSVEIKLTAKPWLASWEYVESEIRKLF